MIMTRTKKEEAAGENTVFPLPPTSEKDRLLALYQTLKDLGVRSISDLENLIARA